MDTCNRRRAESWNQPFDLTKKRNKQGSDSNKKCSKTLLFQEMPVHAATFPQETPNSDLLLAYTPFLGEKKWSHEICQKGLNGRSKIRFFYNLSVCFIVEKLTSMLLTSIGNQLILETTIQNFTDSSFAGHRPPISILSWWNSGPNISA